MRQMIMKSLDWLGEVLAEIADDERPVPGRPPRITVDSAPRWVVYFNWILLGFVLGLVSAAATAQVCMWLAR